MLNFQTAKKKLNVKTKNRSKLTTRSDLSIISSDVEACNMPDKFIANTSYTAVSSHELLNEKKETENHYLDNNEKENYFFAQKEYVNNIPVDFKGKDYTSFLNKSINSTNTSSSLHDKVMPQSNYIFRDEMQFSNQNLDICTRKCDQNFESSNSADFNSNRSANLVKNLEKAPNETLSTTDHISQISSPLSLDNRDNLVAESNIKSLNSSIKISDNPFDMLTSNKYKINDTSKPLEANKMSSTTDDEILACIKKQKRPVESKKIDRRYGIFKQIKILSKKEIIVPTKKYFKFPFEINVYNDGSSMFELFRNEFSSALSSVYANYRRFSEPFRVFLQGEVIDFSKNLKCTKGLSRMLTLNDVSFRTEADFLIVEDRDIGIVYDIVLNYDIPVGKPIPFILSEYEFENGIVFRSKFKREAIVKHREQTEFSYVLSGPFFSEDIFIDEDVHIYYD